MAADRRGEIWLVLVKTSDTRPRLVLALVVSVPALDYERALVSLVPHYYKCAGHIFPKLRRTNIF